MNGHDSGQQSDFFAGFDLADYVSNGEQLDVFASVSEHSVPTIPSQQTSNGNGQTVAMMTEALSRQLQDMHSTGGSLNSTPHHTISPAPRSRQLHPGLATPLSMRHGEMALNASPALNPTPSSGHITPIGGHGGPSPNVLNDPATEMLKEQLSKQLQIQRLQHMQNQLLQQQIELITGNGANSFDAATRMSFGGLLTPASSSEMRPTIHPDLVSPMLMQQQQQQQPYPSQQDLQNALYALMTPGSVQPAPRDHSHQHQPMTAPASMVFHNAGHRTPGGEYFSPLTSPALGPSDAQTSDVRFGQQDAFLLPSASSGADGVNLPHAHLSQYGHPSQLSNAKNTARGNRTSKRRSSVDEPLSRKRASPIFPPVLQQSEGGSGSSTEASLSPFVAPTHRGRRMRAGTGTSTNASTSTLVSPSGQSIFSPDGSAGNQPGGAQNTPSPVDLDSTSMPPPAAPHPATVSSSSSYMAPVTPGSIMNLGAFPRPSTGFGFANPAGTDRSPGMSNGAAMFPELEDIHLPGSGSITPVGPSDFLPSPNLQRPPAAPVPSSAAAKKSTPASSTRARAGSKSGKSASAPNTFTSSTTSSSSSSTAPKTARGAAARSSVISPGLKPILPGPAGGSVPHPSSLEALGLKSLYQPTREAVLAVPSSPALDATIGGPKKTSHKAAEQKRRDSLKSGFDDLRILLPPVTYDPEKDVGENGARPAGSLPPRGPPRNMPGLGGDHPNRGVSKLALLRAANEHIVRLQRRVERRDAVMEGMRRELEALRLEVGIGTVAEENEDDIGDEDTVQEIGDDGAVPSEPTMRSKTKNMIWKDLKLVDLKLDVDAPEMDEVEQKSLRIAAQPSEHLARIAQLQQAQSSSSSS